MYVWGVNSTVTKHSDYFASKDMSERTARRYDDSVDKKRVNSCVLAPKAWLCMLPSTNPNRWVRFGWQEYDLSHSTVAELMMWKLRNQFGHHNSRNPFVSELSWESTCVYVCLYARTHTHYTWGTQCEPRGRDETHCGSEESSWTKSRHICCRICVQGTHVYMYAGMWDVILD